MGGGEREAIGLSLALSALTQLRCPNVRLAEGSQEWRDKQGQYRRTPDMMAGLIRGEGSPHDFLIDVVQPMGASYENEKAGAPNTARLVKEAVAQGKDGISTHGFDTTFPEIYGPINKKLVSYSCERQNSPMWALVFVIDLVEEPYVGTHLLAQDMIRGLGSWLGVDELFDSADDREKYYDAWLNKVNDVLFHRLPLNINLMFLMIVVIRPDGHQIRVLVNAYQTRRESPWISNAVVKWLLRMLDPNRPPIAF